MRPIAYEAIALLLSYLRMYLDVSGTSSLGLWADFIKGMPPLTNFLIGVTPPIRNEKAPRSFEAGPLNKAQL